MMPSDTDKTTSRNNSGHSTQLTRAEMFAIYDALPAELRKTLQSSTTNWNPEMISTWLRKMKTRGAKKSQTIRLVKQRIGYAEKQDMHAFARQWRKQYNTDYPGLVASVMR
jgi:hypothetical protein